ncbi:MAG: hypothetical protein J6M15_04690 [Prevotella sp.]|nr:hypothetical protein [Prevotella sp.]
MRILHYIPKNDSMITSYVDMLVNSMGLGAENMIVDAEAAAKEKLQSAHFDILHIHGCWHYSAYRVLKLALKKGTRMVLSPYGQLEPWILEEHYWKDKLPKKMLFQKEIVERAYAVIIQGKMEEECIRKLGWNDRTEIIRNPVITHSTTPAEMAQKTYLVYRKVLDSHTIELMREQTLHLLRCFIKAGITGDSRWVTDDLYDINDPEQWRYILIYAHYENISSIVLRGAHLLNYQIPDTDIHKISCYLPNNYEMPKSIQDAIGMQYPSENDRLMATFRQVRKLILHHQLTISHLCEIDQELREHDVEEDHLAETLKDAKLYKTACRVMQLLADNTGFDEGFMPFPPLDDRITTKIDKQIYNHLKI